MTLQVEGTAQAKAKRLERAWPVGETARSSLWLEHGVGWGAVQWGGRRARKGLGMGSSLRGQHLSVLGGPAQHCKGQLA